MSPDFSYTGRLNPQAVRNAIRGFPDGMYEIINGHDDRRVVPYKEIVQTIEEEGWEDSRGTIGGLIKSKNLRGENGP